VSRYPGQIDLAPLQFDEKQHIDTPEHDGVDVKEVAREGASGLRPKEIRP
jgi:hypothetical protein